MRSARRHLHLRKDAAAHSLQHWRQELERPLQLWSLQLVSRWLGLQLHKETVAHNPLLRIRGPERPLQLAVW